METHLFFGGTHLSRLSRGLRLGRGHGGVEDRLDLSLRLNNGGNFRKVVGSILNSPGSISDI